MDTPEKQHVPTANQELHCLFYLIEVGLRELIIEELDALKGSEWPEQSLPVDILGKFQSGERAEQKGPWTHYVPHHPLYYVDFPDLATIIEKRINWSETFSQIFRRKDVFAGLLRTLEPIRNKVAHNRRAVDEDLCVVRSAHSQLVSAIGEERFANLVSRNTTAASAPEMIRGLLKESRQSLTRCLKCELLSSLGVWDEISDQWWFHSTILDANLDVVETYFATIEQYRQLPRGRGSGYRLQAWVRTQELPHQQAQADQVLTQLLERLSNGQ